MGSGLVLSLFPGIDLLGRGFEEAGFCVVRGPDLITGGDVRNFAARPGLFEGVIGGPPCQKFSLVNRRRDTAGGEELVLEFARVVREAAAEWFLMENVVGVTELQIEGFEVQRFTMDCREVGNRQRRLRVIQFGSRDGSIVTVRRGDRSEGAVECVMASEGRRATRRGFDEVCRLQGLEGALDLPGWTVEGMYRAVGNAVPLDLARELGRAVRDRSWLQGSPKCVCGCGRDVPADGQQAGAACRQRMKRRRDRAASSARGR
jgi:DNA (cytosine-5)-methyltransferase 1